MTCLQTDYFFSHCVVHIFLSSALKLFSRNFTTPDKTLFNKKTMDIFLISPQLTCCGYSLEVPQRGTSNEYPQHTF